MKPILIALAILWPWLLIAQELEPEQVQILALHHKNPIRPQVTGHQYDPRRPDKAIEPYTPQLSIKRFHLPQDHSMAESVSWVARFSGQVAGTLMGSQGQMEAGVLAYQKGNYPEASKRFSLILQKGKSALVEKAAAWQAWTLYHLEEMESSYELTQDLTGSNSPIYRAEGFYLGGLHLFRSGQNQELDQWLEKAEKNLEAKDWNFRLRYLKFAHLVRSQKWKQARIFLMEFEKSGIKHSPHYGAIKEMEGLIAYNESDFPKALQAYGAAYELSPAGWDKSRTRQIQAWLHYLSANYEDASRQAGEELALGVSKNEAELTYLLIACKVRKQEGKGLAELLGRIEKKSPFYSYGAFQIRAFYKNLPKEPKLKALVQKEDFPFKEIRFYTALLEGQSYFQAGQIKQAEKQFLSALAVDSNSGLYWIAGYNMGLVHLKRERFDKAAKLFESLAKEKEPTNKLWLGYHLLYAYYKEEKAQAFLATFPKLDLSELEPQAQWEVHLMKGSLQYGQGKHKKAVAAFSYGWEVHQQPQALGFIAQVHYQQGEYQKVLDLAQKHRDVKSQGLLRYRVKTLLALNRGALGMRILEQEKLQGDVLLDLHVEVWLHNREYQKISDRVNPLLKKAQTPAAKYKYRLILGDAYYNQKAYEKAHAQFKAAAGLTPDPKAQAQAKYNQALSSYAAKDWKTFEIETNQALAGKLEPGTRYQLTLILANHHFAQGEISRGDEVLSHYVRTEKHKANQMRIRQTQLQYDRGEYGNCAQMAKGSLNKPTDFERRDMAILHARCAVRSGQEKEVLASLEKELMSAQGDYRKAELTLLLAEARHHAGGYNASQETLSQLPKQGPKKLQLQARLLKAKNLYRMGQFKEGDETLGEPSQYREIREYKEALQLQTEMKTQSGDLKQAVKNHLRLYYRKGTKQAEKQGLLLKIAELYIKDGKPELAKEYLNKFTPALAPDLDEKYNSILAQLKGK